MNAGNNVTGFTVLNNSVVIDNATAEKLKQEISDKLIAELSAQAAALNANDIDELAIDWMNGRRTPDANQLLKGAITNLSLGSNAPKIAANKTLDLFFLA